MYTLYGYPRSGSTAVEFTLAELDVPYRFEIVPLDTDFQRSEEYRKINPQGKIPALVCDDGTVLTESVAIVLWLLEAHDDHKLLPPIGSAERATALRWLLFIASDLYQLVEINDYPERFAVDSDPEMLRNRIRELWRERWLLIEDTVQGPWLLGNRFSVTDIYIAVVSRWAQQDDWRPGHLPKIEAIFQQVAQRPACIDVWQRSYV